ncbi:MAG TPA: hypothetical protein VGE54_10355 [Brevundimonas sp.]
MLVEPPEDEARLALDRAVADAVAARIAAGSRSGPDADAIALRALLADIPTTSRATVRALLGRIEAATASALTVHGPLSEALAADRFGLGYGRAADPAAALKTGRALIDISAGAWWGRLLAAPDLRVVAALPDDRHGRPHALLVARSQPGPTGDDRTFWVTDSAWSDARIIAGLSDAGLAASLLAAAGGLKLFALAGYVQAEDPRLASAPGALNGVIGAAPLF